MAKEGDHYKLAFNSPDTWSQKYNLVWDELLGYNLFPKSVRDTRDHLLPDQDQSVTVCRSIAAPTTPSSTGSCGRQPSPTLRLQFNALVDPIYKWTNETPTRVPLTDWYDTKTGKQVGFQARSVVGGVFIKALADKQLTEKWRAKDKEN